MMARLTGGGRQRAALLCLCVALAACNHKAVQQTRAQPGDRAVARVDGKIVWASDVNREAVAQGLIGQGEPLDVTSDQFRQVLDEVIDEKLLATEAIHRGLQKDVTVQRRLAAAQERILGDILLENSVGKTVNEDAVRGLYAEMLKNSAPTEEIVVRQIVLASQPDADQVKKALAGGASFDALAAERSKDETTRFKGGLLPTMTVDMLPPAYAPPLKSAALGQLVGPFKTDAGWVVARVDERRQRPPPTLDSVRPLIDRFLTFDQVKDLILNLRRKARIEPLIPPPLAVRGAPTEPASAPPSAFQSPPPVPAPPLPPAGLRR
ncbi:MAG TPA: peptidylprolyl isomerase [Caulobacteraceae bacterium]